MEAEDNDYEEYYSKDDINYLGGSMDVKRIPNPETPSFNFDPSTNLEEL